MTQSGSLKFFAFPKNISRKIRRHLLRNTAQPFFFLTIKQNLELPSGAGKTLRFSNGKEKRLPLAATMR
jgi:hypothetical protein